MNEAERIAGLEAEVERLRREKREVEERAGRELEEFKLRLGEVNLKMWELKEELEEAHERSDRLLHNILPARVIDELRLTGHSEPECFEAVTVFFSDIVNFTEKSSTLEPRVLIDELSDIFTNFDRIFVSSGCERIKTIGDAYLSVSGLPVPDPAHCDNILRAACRAMRYLEERNRRREAEGRLVWQMRMGVHTGQVVGGIVGTEKYLYDIFGDTINTASRMENHSETMKINVSGTTRQLAGPGFRFTARPPRTVKGKGVMRMFFLEWEGRE